MKLAPLILENAHVRLRPFDPGTDGPELYALAERAPEIFRLWSYRGPGDWWASGLNRSAIGRMMAP